MIALTEPSVIALISGTLSGLTLLAVAVIGRRGRSDAEQAQSDRTDIKVAIKAKNGHATLGDGVAALEDRLIAGDARFDRIEVKLDEQNERFGEHIAEVAPLAVYVRKQMRKGK